MTYLTKPFSIPELIARIKALFRRVDALKQPPTTGIQGEIIKWGGMVIDVDKRHVLIGNKEVELTALLHPPSRPCIQPRSAAGSGMGLQP
ncbi:MAG: hypothetical protein V3U62_06900 [Sedimenticolaceae bacterium]